VGHGGRLGRLRVRVQREDRLGVPGSDFDERRAQPERRAQHGDHVLPLAHPVQRHVDVVAAPRRVQPPGDALAARRHELALDVIEQVLVRAVVLHVPDVVQRHRVQGAADGSRVGLPDDARVGQHHEMRVVHRHDRVEEERFGILEVLVEDAGHVFRREFHKE
jgi:hypothetical protein